MVKRLNRVNDPASNVPHPSGGNRKDSITSAHSLSGQRDVGLHQSKGSTEQGDIK